MLIGEDLVDTDDDEEGGLTDLSYATETSFIQVYKGTYVLCTHFSSFCIYVRCIRTSPSVSAFSHHILATEISIIHNHVYSLPHIYICKPVPILYHLVPSILINPYICICIPLP